MNLLRERTISLWVTTLRVIEYRTATLPLPPVLWSGSGDERAGNRHDYIDDGDNDRGLEERLLNAAARTVD
jgi:hypothetical protein